ncbi:EamA family transporter RarD [Rhodobacter sp. NTK016B]|uniref:EamA family transporter RarD n=1 Tax=Rhodobacter sp. NTK016B TaxID=2759676 RepID=UPI001A8C9827|nr:EamA family transporter RarD [Rhodobacter sp. NTK016B]MBN8290404.1 EamA family transporter RarD [Rhodobacter sp. NTK016B]
MRATQAPLTASLRPEPADDSRALDGDSLAGFLLALSAYLLWGALPLYLRLLDHVAVPEVLAHRVIWSVPLALAVLWATGRLRSLGRAMRDVRMLGMAALTAALVSCNWGVYLYSIASGQAMSAALGYYINPIFSVLLAALVLRERLSPLQWAAVALAALAVVILTIEAGRLPILSLALTVSWGFYALAKRALPIGPNQSFALEVMLLSPFALGYLGWLGGEGTLAFGATGGRDIALLMGCGVVTAVPLMLYANGAKRLRLTTIGLMQYIAPTCIFLIAVFLFGEPFEGAKLWAFPMIWGALVLYSADLWARRR